MGQGRQTVAPVELLNVPDAQRTGAVEPEFGQCDPGGAGVGAVEPEPEQ